MKRLAAVFTSLLLAATAGSAQVDDHAKTKRGAVVGAVAGGIVGAVIGNNCGDRSAGRGAVGGAVAGEAVGAIAGAMMDRQERELGQIDGVSVSRTAPGELNVSVRNEVLFDFNSTALRSGSRQALRDMSGVLGRYPDTTIKVEGFTDSIGSATYNEQLSERRADSVASYLENLRVHSGRIRTIGYGESHPRASNATASGRQRNRRVEIHIKANNT